MPITSLLNRRLFTVPVTGRAERAVRSTGFGFPFSRCLKGSHIIQAECLGPGSTAKQPSRPLKACHMVVTERPA
jgi:hypothetical protein